MAFDIRVGVHQGSASSPLLLITVMKQSTKLARGDGPWELLYADDLVLTAESKEEVTDMLCCVLKVINGATKDAHAGLRNLRGVQNVVCPKFAERRTVHGDGNEDDKSSGVVVNGSVLEEVE